MGTTTSWPGVSRTAAAICAIVRPSTVVESPCRRSRLSSSRMTSATPPASYMSAAVNRPPGAMSATIGVRSAISPNSSMSSEIPNSWAIARRWRTPLVEPRVDRSVVENHGRDVEAAERHHRGGNGLVAADEADETVEQVAPGHELDRVGDDLAADKGGLHPLGAHRDAVRDRDGVELHRRAATRTDAFLDETGEASLVQVAGHRLDPGGRDAHDRLGEVLVRKSDSLEHRPCASAIGPVRQRAAVALGRVGRAVVWQGPGSPSRRGLRAHRLSLGWSSVPAV